MPEHKHTPAPWRIIGDGIHATVRGDDATIVAVRHRLPAKINEVNMQLIAAAPELLLALEELDAMYARAWDTTDGGLQFSAESVAKFEEAHEKARAAIAKALGQA